MTTIFEITEQCLVCGTVSSHAEIGSTNAMGFSDLDTRPPEMRRSTMEMWVRECPKCGYCAESLEEGGEAEAVRKIVLSPEYRKQLKKRSFPRLANRFLCRAMILEAQGVYGAAGWAALSAAWACDDSWENYQKTDVRKKMETSSLCRQRATELFILAQKNGDEFAEGDGVQEAILADVLRRSEWFDAAVKSCLAGLEKQPEEIIQKILLFEKKLAEERDVYCYTLGHLVD